MRGSWWSLGALSAVAALACEPDTSANYLWGALQDERAGPPELAHEDARVESLSSEIVSDDELLGMPAVVRLVGSRLLVVDPLGDETLLVFDARTGALQGSFGRRGGGPTEFTGYPQPVPGRGPYSDADTWIWLYDHERGRIRIGDVGRQVVIDSLLVRLESRPWEPAWLDDTLLAARVRDGVHAFHIFDTSGAVVRRVAGDTSGWGRIPEADRADARRAHACVSPDGSRVALAYRHTGRVELYDARGELLARAQTPHPFEPWVDLHPIIRLKYRQGLFTSGSPNHRSAYYDCAATNEHVYAVFSGRLHKDFRRTQHQSRHVHVFDWSGRLVRVIALDHGTATIAVDVDETAFYTGDLTSLIPAIRRTRLKAASGETDD